MSRRWGGWRRRSWAPGRRRCARLDTGARAVAGRTSLHLTPLAICALSASAASPRTNAALLPAVELLEYGFRRGVAYNLLKLNPHGPTAEHFVLNPLGQPGVVGPSLQVSEVERAAVCLQRQRAVSAHRQRPGTCAPALSRRAVAGLQCALQPACGQRLPSCHGAARHEYPRLSEYGGELVDDEYARCAQRR